MAQRLTSSGVGDQSYLVLNPDPSGGTAGAGRADAVLTAILGGEPTQMGEARVCGDLGYRDGRVLGVEETAMNQFQAPLPNEIDR